ncbi:MAG: hypothetical protein RL018_1813 [Pseudomonadota bacterium]|jgi:hypothetical protein
MSQVALRLPDSLQSSTKQLATNDSSSLNQFIVMAVAEKISAYKTGTFFEKRLSDIQTESDLRQIIDSAKPRKPRLSGQIGSEEQSFRYNDIKAKADEKAPALIVPSVEIIANAKSIPANDQLRYCPSVGTEPKLVHAVYQLLKTQISTLAKLDLYALPVRLCEHVKPNNFELWLATKT